MPKDIYKNYYIRKKHLNYIKATHTYLKNTGDKYVNIYSTLCVLYFWKIKQRSFYLKTLYGEAKIEESRV